MLAAVRGRGKASGVGRDEIEGDADADPVRFERRCAVIEVRRNRTKRPSSGHHAGDARAGESSLIKVRVPGQYFLSPPVADFKRGTPCCKRRPPSLGRFAALCWERASRSRWGVAPAGILGQGPLRRAPRVAAPGKVGRHRPAVLAAPEELSALAALEEPSVLAAREEPWALAARVGRPATAARAEPSGQPA